MKTLKRIGLVLLGLIVLIFIIAAFTRKDYSVEREVTINQPREKVFAYIKQLKNQDNFSKWAMRDPNMKKEYRGTDGTEGFVYAWDSDEEAGKGEQKILKITEGERIELKLHFIKPMEADADSHFITETVNTNSTKVKWGFSSTIPYPMNFMLVVMDLEGMLGKDLDESLNNLKSILEKQS